MSDLIDDPMPGSNTPEFSVSEIAGSVKKLVEAELGWVRVRGEVGRVVLARPGHLYFDLKDDRSVLSCMTWKGQVAGLGMRPEEGMEVVAEGKMTASGFQSKFALNAQRIAVAGEGALMAMLEKRKKALAAEGLFDEALKRPLPYLPEVIGVVTSLQGVVIRDILHRLRDRFPRKVLVWPVAVQGEACAPEVVRGIEGFNAMTPGGALPRPDLIIVARGGGSIEDLWGFNEENVARAAAASDIPLISAVGHETDTTLIDFVSDRRAPTPTAAAELAVPVRHELLAWVEGQGARLSAGLSRALSVRQTRLADVSRALPRADALTAQARQRLDFMEARLPQALQAAAQRKRVRLSETAGSLRPAALRKGLADRRRDLERLAARLAPGLQRGVVQDRERFGKVAARLRGDALRRDLRRSGEDLTRVLNRLSVAATTKNATWQSKIEALDRVRQTLGYKATLRRGYAVVRGDGVLVTTKVAAAAASAIEIEFNDGTLDVGAGQGAGATAGEASTVPQKKPSRARKPKADPPDQGSLF